MAVLEDDAARASVHSMIAGVSAANPAGVAFQARIGHAEIARLPQVGYRAGRWLDIVLMRKMLSAAPDSGPAAG